LIRRTIKATKLATYSVDLPNAAMRGMPTPMGTGFFVSHDGWFITAAHVITENNRPDGPVRRDIGDCRLMKEMRPGEFPSGGMCQGVAFELVDPATDFALLKVSFEANTNKAHLQGQSDFPYLPVSSRDLEEGEQVYAFGYPLSGAAMLADTSVMAMGTSAHSPRTTSAIVASTMEHTKFVSTSGDPKVYVLDKALNYGNSGGPIVAVDTGHVHALCSRFQPVQVPQPHIRMTDGNPMVIHIPSLYGIVSSLGNARVMEALRQRQVPITDK
jgi:serine protease Do